MRRRLDVRAVARRATGGQPTVRTGLRSRSGRLDAPTVRAVLELALRIGEAMLSLGAAAVDATATIRRVVTTFGLGDCHIDLTFTSITLSYDRGTGGAPVTMMRTVEERLTDYGRLQRVLEVAQDVTASPVAPERAGEVVDDAHARLDVVVDAPQQYHRWVVTGALAALASAVALLLGGGPGVALVAGATTAVIDRVVWLLAGWGLPPFFRQAAGAAVAASVAVLIHLVVPLLPFELEALPPSLVVASGIVVLLAGLSLVGAAEDAISGFPITAGARTFEVVLLTAGIVVGIAGVLDLARRWGVQLVLLDPPVNTTPLALQVVASGAVALAFAVANHARPRAVAVAGVTGGIAWLVLSLVLQAGVGPAVASTVAATVVGFVAESTSGRLRVPAIVTSVCAIVPLLPGLAIYRGLFLVIEDPTSGLTAGTTQLAGAALVGLGLAAGVTLGEFLAAPLRRGTRRAR